MGPSGRYSFLPVKIIAFAAKISIIMRPYYYFGALANKMAIMSKDSCGPGHCPFDFGCVFDNNTVITGQPFLVLYRIKIISSNFRVPSCVYLCDCFFKLDDVLKLL